MEVERQDTSDEVKRLRACINDLVSVLALPAMWGGHEPSHIARTLLDALLSMLRLDFAYLRVPDLVADKPIEMIRVAERRNSQARAEDVGRALDPCLTGKPVTSSLVIPNPLGEGQVSIAHRCVALRDEMGVIVAASARTDFPTETEKLLFDVAANQAVIGLQEARRLIEHRQVAQELDRRVAERTKELLEREAKIRRLFDANIIGIMVVKLDDGKIVDANEAFLRMVGYGREDLVSGRILWPDLTPPEWRETDARMVAELRANKVSPPIEKELFRKDGSRVPVLGGAALFEGGADEGVAFVLDLSEQKRAEQALHAAMSERIRLTAFRAEVGTVLAHEENLRETLHKCAESTVRHLDAAFARVWTLSSDARELQLQASAGMYTRLDGSHSRIPFGQLKIGLIAQERKPHLTNNVQNDQWVNDKEWARREKMISFAGYPLLVEDRVVGVLGMFSQKTLTEGTLEALSFVADAMAQVIDRKRAEEALRRSEAYLAEAQRLSHTGSWAWNVRTGEIFWSQEVYRIYEYDPNQTKPTWSRIFDRVHPDDRRSRFRWRRRRRVGARAKPESTHKDRWDSEANLRIILPDGSIKHLQTIAHPVLNDSGKVTEIIGTVMDVTERKRAEEERERLRQLQAELAHMNRVSMMGELAASLAHEMKQPITAAATNAKTSLRWLQRETPEIEEACTAASRVIQDVNRAADIINHLRSLYIKGIEQRELVDVNEIIEQMTALLRSEASRYSIPIRTALAKNLPNVMADRVQLQQVIMNIMLNGIEAMRDSAGELVIESCQTEDAQLLISIRDAGVGLPTEKVDQIFDAFFTTKQQGTGMGLAITRSIVEAHGGRVWATGNSPRGATFHFTLPIEGKAAQAFAGT